MAATVGAAQIQARGTLAGNLASGSPAGDGVAALAALDAEIVLASHTGERRIPLSAFYTGYRKTVRRPDELIARIEMELPRGPSRQEWRKVGSRSAQAISKVALGGIAVVTGGQISRIGLGMASVAPTTAFLPSVRALALGRTPLELSAAALDEATARDVSPIDDIRSTAAYRLHVARALIRNFVTSLAAG
jgi:CO/xanthine dehydrogenase FAD-binding subunit